MREKWVSGPELDVQAYKWSLPHNSAVIYLLWDIHYGARQARYDFLRRTVKEIASQENAYAILGGDVLEAISISDWRMLAGKFDATPPGTKAEDLRSLFNLVLDAFQEDFGPLKGKVLAVLEGNHEEKLGRFLGLDFTALLAEFLGAPYLGYEAGLAIGLSDGHYVYIAITHGWGGGRYVGGKVNRLDQWAGWWDGIDVAVAGHTHDGPFVVPVQKQKIVFRGGQAKVVPKTVWLVKPGHMRGDAYYRQKRGLRSTPNGYVKLKVAWYSGRRQVKIEPVIVLER